MNEIVRKNSKVWNENGRLWVNMHTSRQTNFFSSIYYKFMDVNSFNTLMKSARCTSSLLNIQGLITNFGVNEISELLPKFSSASLFFG